MDNCPAENLYKMVYLTTGFEEVDCANLNAICRLNTKIASRDLEVKDLVKDLSDGVSYVLV
jgi:hypothetical protein